MGGTKSPSDARKQRSGHGKHPMMIPAPHRGPGRAPGASPGHPRRQGAPSTRRRPLQRSESAALASPPEVPSAGALREQSQDLQQTETEKERVSARSLCTGRARDRRDEVLF